MLKKLRIQNFKGWKDTGTINLAPMTLFFGANSSGKSSIGQFLMMLKQTVDSQDRNVVFYQGSKDSAVQMGSFQEMVFKHNLENKIAFSYQWELPKALPNYTISEGIVTELNFSAEVSKKDQTSSTAKVENFNYTLLGITDETEKGQITEIMSLGVKFIPENKSYKMESTGYSLIRKHGRVWPITNTIRFYGFSSECVAYYQNADFVQDLNFEHEKLFSSLCYLGPLRTKTSRLYTWNENAPENVGFFGENTVPAILSASRRRFSFRPREHYRYFPDIIALELKKMGLIEKFKTERISPTRQEYEVKVATKGSQDLVALPDVGFGLSQVLPVLVQCFYAPAGSIIIMEQPEIHLHPSAQSALADVMIDVINSRENGKQRNIQLIIETHSEHFLRRVQRRIAEETITRDKVSVYFANTNQNPVTLDALQVDNLGNITNWPEDFFGDEVGDIIAQNSAAMARLDNTQQPVD